MQQIRLARRSRLRAAYSIHVKLEMMVCDRQKEKGFYSCSHVKTSLL